MNGMKRMGEGETQRKERKYRVAVESAKARGLVNPCM
jgi:hypothetical protein